MRVKDLARLSTRMFKTNPLRTWLTILGMGVGTGAVVILVGLGFGLQQIILEQIVFGETLLSLGVTATGAQNLAITEEVIDEFESMDNVVDAAPLARYPALVTYKGLTGNIFLQGAEPAYLRYSGITASAGNIFEEEDSADDSSVMISPSVLQLFAVEDPESFIGEKVTFRILIRGEGEDEVNEVALDKEYTVRGVTKEEGVLNALMMLPELQRYVGVDEFDRAQVRVSDNQSLTPVEEALIEKGYRVTALSKTVEQASKIFQGVQAVLATFGGIALVVSAIGMFNTMTVTLLERTKEIGIMRTIGASPQDIKWLVVSESIVVGCLGGLSGIVMGVGLGITLNILLNVVATQFGGTAVQLFAFPPTFLLFIALFSAGVGYLTGIFPARCASQLNPLDAIRYE